MAKLKALFFDQDGVIVDTERDGHRVAFNRAFRELGLPVQWDVATYGELLTISGGKERARHFLQTAGFGVDVPRAEEDEFIASLHRRKTEIFVRLIESGALELRPGVRRLMREAKQAGLQLAVCTTSNERAARAVTGSLLAGITVDHLLAGDIVAHKKPAPDIYLLALERGGLNPDECVVIEDSENGVRAARAAGLRVLATPSTYTIDEDLSGAEVVVSCLGDPDGEKAELLGSLRPVELSGVVDLAHLEAWF